jgi:nitrilase
MSAGACPAQGEVILIAEGSLDVVLAAKGVSDIGGHYSRPDLLRLIVDRNLADRVVDCGIAGRVEPQMWE